MDDAKPVPGGDLESFEQLAAAPERKIELTARANAALARSGQPSDDGEFLRESERLVRDSDR